MLNIVTTNKQILIDKDGVSYGGFPKNSLRYSLLNNALQLFISSRRETLVTEKWRNGISINGEAVTPENAELMLEPLFAAESGGGGGSTENVQTDYLEEDPLSGAYLKNRPLTLLAEGDDLPETDTPGHLAVYRDADGNTKEVHEFDGFFWHRVAADYNFIAGIDEDFDYVFGNNDILYKKEADGLYYLVIEPGRELQSMTVTNLQKLSTDYTIENLYIRPVRNRESVVLESFKARQAWPTSGNNNFIWKSFTVKDGYTDSLYFYNTDKIHVENIRPLNEERDSVSVLIYRAQEIYVKDINMSAFSVELTEKNDEDGNKIPFDYRIETVNIGTAMVDIRGGEVHPDSTLDLTLDLTKCSSSFMINQLCGIKSVRINLGEISEHYFDVSVYRCNFASEEVLDNFIEQICGNVFPEELRFIYQESTPALTDEHRAKLESAGFEIQ